MEHTEENRDDNWRLKHNQLEKEYYDIRIKFHNQADRYYRQSPYGSYIEEDDMLHSLIELKRIREQLKEISKVHPGAYRHNIAFNDDVV